MTYLRNALSHINNEERQRSVRQRLTSVQKNRIALKYIKFRENQIHRNNTSNSADDLSASQPNIIRPQVTGGFDLFIEKYGEK